MADFMDWFRSQEKAGILNFAKPEKPQEVHPFFDARFFRNTRPEEGYLNPFSAEPAHPPNWHYSEEFNGVPSGWVFKELPEETKALVPVISKPAQSSFSHSRNLSRNIKLGLLGLGAIGLTGWMFSGRDDNYNNIEGLLHVGSAQQLRKQNTEFGSGWDPLRRLLGEGFEAFTKTSSFKESLSKAKLTKTLGEGSYGLAELMSAKVNIGGKEHPFNFVRKSMRLSSEEEILKEASMYEKLGHLNAPSLYGVNEQNQILMEHIEGDLAHRVILKGGSLKPETVEDLASFVDQTHKMGIAHGDMVRDVSLYHGTSIQKGGTWSGQVVPHNVIITPEGRAGVIDFGEAVETGSTFIGMRSQTYLGRTDIPNAKALDDVLIDGLRKQKGKVSPQYRKDTEKLALAETEVSSSPQPAIISRPMAKSKLEMAQTQRAVVLDMFENGRSGGRRSKSSFVSSRSMVRTAR